VGSRWCQGKWDSEFDSEFQTQTAFLKAMGDSGWTAGLSVEKQRPVVALTRVPRNSSLTSMEWLYTLPRVGKSWACI
jgi:hypothetical protein